MFDGFRPAFQLLRIGDCLPKGPKGFLGGGTNTLGRCWPSVGPRKLVGSGWTEPDRAVECSDGRVATSELALVEPDVWKPNGVPDASVFQPPRKGVGTPLRAAARKGEAVCKSCGGRCVGLLHGGPCASAFLVAKKRQGVAFVHCS